MNEPREKANYENGVICSPDNAAEKLNVSEKINEPKKYKRIMTVQNILQHLHIAGSAIRVSLSTQEAFENNE